MPHLTSLGVGPAQRLLIRQWGYSIERRVVTEALHYTAEAWVDMVSTYSNVLTLTPEARSGLRAVLLALIGAAGVEAENTATAVVCEHLTGTKTAP